MQKTYAYTYANLLSSVDHEGLANDSTMLWDAAGNRVRFTPAVGSAYTFVYDTTAGIPAVIEEVTPTGSVYYVREPNGGLIARVSGQTTQYYHFDDLGSVLFLTDGDGVLTDRYAYDAWGNGTHEGSTSQPYQYVGRLGYYTHYQDANLPLLQLGVRFYDPRIGRFTQRDPTGDGWNHYGYVGENPITRVDPFGLEWTGGFGIGGGWGIGGQTGVYVVKCCIGGKTVYRLFWYYCIGLTLPDIGAKLFGGQSSCEPGVYTDVGGSFGVPPWGGLVGDIFDGGWNIGYDWPGIPGFGIMLCKSRIIGEF